MSASITDSGVDSVADVPRLGVLMNAHSGRNRSSTAAVDTLLSHRTDVIWRRTETVEAVPDALREMAATGVNVLAVNGGDGTLQRVLNILLGNGNPFSRMPALAILPGGTTNMVAYDLGAARMPGEELKRLLGRYDAHTLTDAIVRRPVIRLTGGNVADAAHGFFFGAAGVYEATMANRHSVDAIGIRDGLGPGLRILNIAAKVLVGRDPVDAVPFSIALNDGAPSHRTCLAMFASTLERLSLGIVPFWGTGPGAIRITMIDEGASHLLRVAWPLLHGRPHKWLTRENGYDSVNVDTLDLSFSGGCVLDGEIFHCTPQTPLHLAALPPVIFIRG